MGRCEWIDLAALATIALLLRITMVLALSSQPAHDELEYLDLGKSLARGQGFHYSQEFLWDESYRPPLYPVLLSVFYFFQYEPILSIRLFQAALGTLTVIMSYVVARRITGKRWPALLAGFLCTIHPASMTFPSYILTETLFSFLLLAFVLAAVLWLDKKTQRFAVGAGACLGLAILCRANLLPLVLILPALVLMPTPASLRLDNSIRLKGLLAMMVTSSLILAPWCIRNSLMYGRPMLVTNAGGELFWRGNTPIAWALLGGEDVNRENAFREMLSRYGSPTSPIDVDRAAYKEGFNYWQESPAEAVWLKASMFCQMWRLWPTFRERNELALSPQSGVPRFDIRGVKIAWYAAFDLALVLGVFGSINKRFDPRIRILLSLLITATAVGVLYYCDLRHRYPYDLALFQLAAVGAASLNLAVFSKLTFERGRAS